MNEIIQLLKTRVYIETTIPSFYYEERTQPDMIARKMWTRDWWDNQSAKYELVTSLPVIDELNQGNHPRKAKTLSLISDLALITLEPQIADIVDTYISNYVMPDNPKGDAIHLALASYHRCHFLHTWNCAHLANANKFEHIRHINTILGLFVPIITTPIELLHWEDKGK